ncbi:hypothetical protein M758_6G062300 [Ceratodon purpureus]|nr:hypothetical protein M758_6G062300 [Ceratodon purpureus]
MHAVGVSSFGARIIARRRSGISSISGSQAMAVLRMMSLVHSRSLPPTHLSAESFNGRNRIVGAQRLWPTVCTTRSWSSQIRADAGVAAVDATKKAAQSGAFVDGLLGVESEAGRRLTSSQIIFLGTGTSEGIPRVSCLTNPEKSCAVCLAAAQLGNKNRRRNTSVIVRYLAPDGRLLNILIDAGKFFYHSALQWFPYYGIRNLDAVIITHAHADANGGLDDLRDWTNNVQPHIPIYVGLRDLTVMAKSHYYLVDTSVVMKGTAVTKLQFIPMSEEPFEVHGLKVTPLPVWHGPGYRSLGFRVGDVCYISDASEIPAETYPLLENCDLLILVLYTFFAGLSLYDSALTCIMLKDSQKYVYCDWLLRPSLRFYFSQLFFLQDALRPDRSSATHFGMPAVSILKLDVVPILAVQSF